MGLIMGKGCECGKYQEDNQDNLGNYIVTYWTNPVFYCDYSEHGSCIVCPCCVCVTDDRGECRLCITPICCSSDKIFVSPICCKYDTGNSIYDITPVFCRFENKYSGTDCIICPLGWIFKSKTCCCTPIYWRCPCSCNEHITYKNSNDQELEKYINKMGYYKQTSIYFCTTFGIDRTDVDRSPPRLEMSMTDIQQEYIRKNPNYIPPVIVTETCHICAEDKQEFHYCSNCKNQICTECKQKPEIKKCPYCRESKW